MSEEITATYTVEVTPYRLALKWHLHRLTRWKWLVLIVVCLFSALGRASSGARGNEHIVISVIVFPVLVALGVIVWFSLMMRFFRGLQIQQIKSMPTFGKILSFTINDEGLLCKGDSAESFLPWKTVLKSIETPDGSLVYRQANLFEWLPKAAFNSEADYNRFLDLLAAKTKHSKLG